MVLLNSKINELPSLRISLLFSKISEKTNTSKTLERSENFTIAYGRPLFVFLSKTFNTVAAILAFLRSFFLEKSLKFIILCSSNKSLKAFKG